MGSTYSTKGVTNFLVLNGKNWSRWCIQMKAIFGCQEVSEVVEEGFPPLEEGASEAQGSAYKQLKKKDCKAICLLHQDMY
ncbi:hypothetical protein Lal_00036660 [Lupinus albus]|nr:hypothetical protein Lal_00036660 [Lupinus albus]